MRKAGHPFFLVVVTSAMLLPVFAQHKPIGRDAVQIRAVIPAATSIVGSQETSAAATPGSTSAQPTTAAAQAPSTTQAASSSPAGATSAASPSSQSAATTHATSAQSSSAPAQAVTTTAVPTTATDAQGQVVTSYVISTAALPSASTSHNNQSDSGSGGLGTGSIIGLSVSGGIAALGIILFFVWKFTRKRFSDFDDNEAIKWPELNAHNNDVHALPTNSTGRAGFGPENDSDINLARAPSPGGAYANSIAASSVPEMYGAGDPYAVPPLPHLNPNQPYHDEPGTYGQPAAYYDPYRGPVPNTFTDTVSDGHAESIPMTQMARMRSPAPPVAYDMQGRGSPAPQAAIGHPGADERSRTPVPGALGTGRASPSSHLAYGYGPR